MTGRKQCPHCRRSIDSGSRICPFCNHDQPTDQTAETDEETLPGPDVPRVEVPPPLARRRGLSRTWFTRILIGLASCVLLAAAFAVGALVNEIASGQLKRKPRAPIAAKTDPVSQKTRALPDNLRDFELVPVEDSTEAIGRAVTSMPNPDPDHQIPDEYRRRDATALPAQKYAELLEQSKKVPETIRESSVDPRSIVAPPPPPRRPPPEEKKPEPDPDPATPEPSAEEAVVTQPKPIEQPLPDVGRIRRLIHEDVTLRLALTVGADGRVSKIDVEQSGGVITPQVISSVQRWVFEPATRNGRPVEGLFRVDLTFEAQ